MKTFLLCLSIVIVAYLFSCQKEKFNSPDTVVKTSSIELLTTKQPISTQNFNTCMANNTSMINVLNRATKPLDKVYSDSIKNAKTETEARALLSKRFTGGDVNLLMSLAYSNKSLTTNISNTQSDWDNKVTKYTDSVFGWTSLPLFEETCEQTRDREITDCDHTEWLLTGCSILVGFWVPWVGIAGSIETMAAHESCVKDAVSSYDKCKSNTK